MLAYSGPVYHATEQDRSGEILAQGTKDFAAGLSGGIDKLSAGIAQSRQKAREAKDENDFLTEQFNAAMHQVDPQKQDPWMLEQYQKFTNGSLGTRRGIVTSIYAGMDRANKMLQQQHDMALRKISLTNTAAYQQAQVDNMQADNQRQDATAIWNQKPDNQEPYQKDMGDYIAVGAVGEKSGTKIYNVMPKPKAPAQPGMVVDQKSGVGYFEDKSGKPVNPEYLINQESDPVAGGPGGAPDPQMILPPPPGAGQAPEPSSLLLPPPDAAVPAPPKPSSDRYKPMIPRRTPSPPKGWTLTSSTGSGLFATNHLTGQVAKYNDEGKWIVQEMPGDTKPASDQVSGKNLLDLLNK